MATGDQPDILSRLTALLPAGWFPDKSPFQDGVMAGAANMGAFIYSLIAYARRQLRIGTATDGFLDLIARDFFGDRLPRRTNELDDPYRARIKAELLVEKGTRAGMIAMLTRLTGRAPVIFEPQRPADTGAYGAPNCGYGVAGGYGSQLLPCQAFVTAFRPSGSGVPLVAGYGVPTGGYRTPSRADYASMSQIIGAVTDADIYAAADNAKLAGTCIWVRLRN
jgi:hypothetical protein